MNALVITLAIFSTVQANSLPKNWKVCKTSDPNKSECLKEAFAIALKDLTNGNPSLGTKSIDPLAIKELSANQVGPGTNFKLTLTDVQLTGLKDVIVDHIETDWKTVKASVHVQSMRIVGSYRMSGTFLALPVTGEGQADLVAEGLKSDLKFKIVEKNVNGIIYNAIDESSLQLDMSRLRTKFDQINDMWNKVMNDNWKALWELLKGSFEGEFRKVLLEIATNIFDKIPRSVFAPK